MTLIHRFEKLKIDIPEGTYIGDQLKELENIPDIITRIDSCSTSRITFDTSLTVWTVNYRVLKGTPPLSINGTVNRICMIRNTKILINGHSFEQID